MDTRYGMHGPVSGITARQVRGASAVAVSRLLQWLTFGVLLLVAVGHADALVHDRLPQGTADTSMTLPWTSRGVRPFSVPMERGPATGPPTIPGRRDVCQSD